MAPCPLRKLFFQFYKHKSIIKIAVNNEDDDIYLCVLYVGSWLVLRSSSGLFSAAYAELALEVGSSMRTTGARSHYRYSPFYFIC